MLYRIIDPPWIWYMFDRIASLVASRTACPIISARRICFPAYSIMTSSFVVDDILGVSNTAQSVPVPCAKSPCIDLAHFTLKSAQAAHFASITIAYASTIAPVDSGALTSRCFC